MNLFIDLNIKTTFNVIRAIMLQFNKESLMAKPKKSVKKTGKKKAKC